MAFTLTKAYQYIVMMSSCNVDVIISVGETLLLSWKEMYYVTFVLLLVTCGWVCFLTAMWIITQRKKIKNKEKNQGYNEAHTMEVNGAKRF